MERLRRTRPEELPQVRDEDTLELRPAREEELVIPDVARGAPETDEDHPDVSSPIRAGELCPRAGDPAGDRDSSGSRTGCARGAPGAPARQWILYVVLLLFVGVIGGGLVDLWTGSRRARVRDRLDQTEKFDREVLDERINGRG